MTQLGDRRNSGLVRDVNGSETGRAFLPVQSGKFAFTLGKLMMDGGDVAEIAGAACAAPKVIIPSPIRDRSRQTRIDGRQLTPRISLDRYSKRLPKQNFKSFRLRRIR